MKNVVIFGSFDIFHPGHTHFIKEAEKFGELIISIAQDEIIHIIKNSLPENTLIQRMNTLKMKYPQHTIIKGDNILGNWSVIKKYKPDVVCVGYDQIKLHQELKKIQKDFGFEIHIISSFYPKIFKSKFLRS